jgi:hypothetical protein
MEAVQNGKPVFISAIDVNVGERDELHLLKPLFRQGVNTSHIDQHDGF